MYVNAFVLMMDCRGQNVDDWYHQLNTWGTIIKRFAVGSFHCLHILSMHVRLKKLCSVQSLMSSLVPGLSTLALCMICDLQLWIHSWQTLCYREPCWKDHIEGRSSELVSSCNDVTDTLNASNKHKCWILFPVWWIAARGNVCGWFCL